MGKRLPSDHLPSCFLTKSLYKFISHLRATCIGRLVLFDLIIQIMKILTHYVTFSNPFPSSSLLNENILLRITLNQ